MKFFRDALPVETLERFESDAYAQKVRDDPKTPQHKADFVMDGKNLKTLYDAGVPVGFGTDSGAFAERIPGFSEHRELEDMVRAGLTPMEAIVCATQSNAELLGVARRRGTVERGKRADLVVLAANPLDDITNTRHIVAIFHDGRQVTPRDPVIVAR